MVHKNSSIIAGLVSVIELYRCLRNRYEPQTNSTSILFQNLVML